MKDQKKLMLLGGNGMLARAVAANAPAGFSLFSYDLPDFDVTDSRQVTSLVGQVRPDVIVNCAAFTNVDGCETAVDLANEVNGDAVGLLAEAARAANATLVHISTDYVFDGKMDRPYVEEDPPCPLSMYGKSKLRGEEALRSSGLEKYFIIRTSWLYGAGGKNFVETMLRLATEKNELRIVADQVGSPTRTVDLAQAIFALLKTVEEASPGTGADLYGVYHFSNEGSCSWFEFAREIVGLARAAGCNLMVEGIHPIQTKDYPLPACRPSYSVLDKAKFKRITGRAVSDWQQSLKLYIDEFHGRR